MRNFAYFLPALTIMSAATAPGAAAQTSDSDLLSADDNTLRTELRSRYDAALAATRENGIISADDPRYMWASEAKVQCAIALGYMKSDTRDETSISKCNYAYGRMSIVTPREEEEVEVETPPPPPICRSREPVLVFFDWDSDVPGAEAATTLRATVDTARQCNWSSFRVVGHTDRSGSDDYNIGLSTRRAEVVANRMASLGINRSQMAVSAEGESNLRVPTEDGVRSPQNRRVEITVSQ